MTKDTKQIIIYGAFGLLLGAKLTDVLFNGGGLLDWWLLLLGIAAAIIHYLPVSQDEKRQEQDGQTAGGKDDNETLVLRDHPDPERSGQLTYRTERPAEWSSRR